MNAKEDKRQKSMKSKLIAAIAMLMVAVIMMVSTTYAWFTLSTAPEVTGISTAVGANGNLEMAMAPKAGYTDLSSLETTGKTLDNENEQDDANRTWGNLVDVSTLYGLEKIELLPSELNTEIFGNNSAPSGAFLKTPTYGSDGRVDDVLANAFTGNYNKDKGVFDQTSDYGVRAIGVASGMTEQQIVYRNALSATATNASKARTTASNSLKTNGGTLGSIILRYINEDTAAKVTRAEVNILITMLTDLHDSTGKDGALDYVDLGLANYILAAAASNSGNEAAYKAIQTEVDNKSTVSAILTTLQTAQVEFTIPTEISKYFEALTNSKSNVTTALNTLNGLTFTPDPNDLDADNNPIEKVPFAVVKTAIDAIANVEKMIVNDTKISEKSKTDLVSQIVSDVLGGKGVTLTLESGAGVYADIADFCGDYQANINMDVEYNGLAAKNIKATMKTKGQDPTKFEAIDTAFKTPDLSAPVSSEGSMPLTEIYGYIIDLAFRTNAATSDLLLQTEAKDRIYNDGGADSQMGHGSTMTFTPGGPEVTDDIMKGLMDCLKIVFFNPTNGTIYATAGLDHEDYTSVQGEAIPIKLITEDASGNEEFVDVQADAKLMSLTQNASTPMSVLVYLDGTKITNADVANAAQSMSGSMNLQFSSSATLVPMDYADLMN